MYRLLQYSLFEESLNGGNEMNEKAIFEYVYSIAEFMIIPKYRRNKLEKRVAFDCFDMYKGNWKVSPSNGSELAYNFWNKVINEYTNNNNKI